MGEGADAIKNLDNNLKQMVHVLKKFRGLANHSLVSLDGHRTWRLCKEAS